MTRTLWGLWAVALAAALLASAARADGPQRPFLAPLFTDDMVLQRGQPDPIWGWAAPGAAVTVRVDGQEASAVAGPDGEWTARLPPLPVGGPYTLSVTGPQSETLRNVLVGDVWLCSGQSNMEFGVGNLLDARAVIAAADIPTIRLFTVPKETGLSPQATAGGQWQVCTPATLQGQGTWNGFSAVGYFFGRDLSENLHVPIGLLLSSYGGTVAEAWTSGPALARHVPDFRDQVAALNRLAQNVQTGGGSANHCGVVPGQRPRLRQRTGLGGPRL